MRKKIKNFAFNLGVVLFIHTMFASVMISTWFRNRRQAARKQPA